MSRLVFSPAARSDLVEIGDYIARDSKANARKFVARLREQCKRIGKLPSAYPLRDKEAGIRFAPIGRYLIFFRREGDMVRIERVLHGARNLGAMLPGAGSSD